MVCELYLSRDLKSLFKFFFFFLKQIFMGFIQKKWKLMFTQKPIYCPSGFICIGKKRGSGRIC